MLSEITATDLQSSRLAVVRRYISDHMDEPLDREVLAAVAGFSVPHLHRLWRAHIGENVAAYVRRKRLQRAALKLRMGAVDITQVALSAGYDTHAAFSRAFKQQYGLSPRQFRNLDCWAATKMVHERG
jgi:AraC family transcriptional regulator